VSEKNRQKLERALLYIDENLDQKLTAVDVANHAYVSRFHFQRLFSAYMGETVNQYVFHRRLEFAAEKMIHNKSVALADLAIESGFSTHSAFSRAFKKQFNVSPSEFRNNPNLIILNHNNMRPFLNTIAPKKRTLEVDVKELSTLWFNYKIAKVDTDTTNFYFHDMVKQIASDFNGFMDVGKPHLFGMKH
jgi:AraC-like DNA-binding protein